MKPTTGLDMTDVEKRGEERGGRNEAEGAPEPTRQTRTPKRDDAKKAPRSKRKASR